MSAKINLFSIGAMRAGSTSLYVGLSAHPEIFVPHIKESYYFVAEHMRQNGEDTATIERYVAGGKYREQEAFESLYREQEGFKYYGDCSHYIIHSQTAETIAAYNPDAKVIVSLRNPIDRMYSEYMLRSREGSQKLSFSDFVRENVEVNSSGGVEVLDHSFFQKGYYATQLCEWYKWFPKDQIMVIHFEDLEKKQSEVFASIYKWLGVDANYEPTVVRAQRGGVPKSRRFYDLIKRPSMAKRTLKKIVPLSVRWKMRDLIYKNLLNKEDVSEKTRKILREVYRPHNEDLTELTGVDYSGRWQ